MALNLHAVGNEAGPHEVTWDSRDVMLYALGVGAGQIDAQRELHLTTENTEAVALQVLPTFALVVAQRAPLRLDLGPIDRTKLVHAEQALTLHRPLVTQGGARIRVRVEAIEDKGSGALVTSATEASDPETGAPLFTARASVFIRGEGGFDSARKPSGSKAGPPERAPDFEQRVPTRPDQALLYRLCADRNPLHSDPAFAARGGFERPILHGLCTYGISVRVLMQQFAAGDVARFGSVSGRFTKPVLPGEALTVQAWADGAAIVFRTLDASGQAVIDGGRLAMKPASRGL